MGGAEERDGRPAPRRPAAGLVTAFSTPAEQRGRPGGKSARPGAVIGPIPPHFGRRSGKHGARGRSVDLLGPPGCRGVQPQWKGRCQGARGRPIGAAGRYTLAGRPAHPGRARDQRPPGPCSPTPSSRCVPPSRRPPSRRRLPPSRRSPPSRQPPLALSPPARCVLRQLPPSHRPRPSAPPASLAGRRPGWMHPPLGAVRPLPWPLSRA